MSKSRRDRAFARQMKRHQMTERDIFDGQLHLPKKLRPKILLSRAKGKHWKTVIEFMGEKRIFIFPKSPSDHRAFLNRKADIRRWVRLVAERHRRTRRRPGTVSTRGEA